MKKILAAIVLLIYFCATTGFVISMHYCMDRFDSAEIGSSKDEKCHKCGMHKNGGCCRDDVKVVKLQTSHLASQIITDKIFTPVTAQAIITEFLFTPLKNFSFKENSTAHSPPLSEQDSYLQNRVFRI